MKKLLSIIKKNAIPGTDFIINHSAVVLLAAGASSRLGQPKQLLGYNGKSFLKNMLSVIKETPLTPVVVVLGSDAEFIRQELEGEKVEVVNNTEWPEGIASSIRNGIQFLQDTDPAADGAIIMVCDQPHITSVLLNDLLTVQRETGKPIAASNYGNAIGTPALFNKVIFPELLLLKGDKGATKILHQQLQHVATVPFLLGNIDIDTPEDYRRLTDK